jgi:hypothetical protein
MVVRIVTRRPAAPAAGTWPLTVSGDGRRVLTAGGASWQGNGEAAWSLAVQLDETDASVYLADRAAKGVNLLLVNLIEHRYSDQTPHWRNAAGDLPFSGTLAGGELDFTAPNEAYWSHVDWLLEQCRALGITVMATPAYLGAMQGDEGWAAEVEANGTTRMGEYGAWLGARYADQPNLIWVIGGDTPPDSGEVGDLTAHCLALAEALRDADPTKLITAHSSRGLSSLDSYAFLADAGLLDLNASYSNADVANEVAVSWGQTPTMPTFSIEALYEGEDPSSATLRQQMYQALLWGGVAQIFGNNPIWLFGADWQAALDSDGSAALGYLGRLLAARDVAALAPDHAHQVVTSGAADDQAVRASSRVLVAWTSGGALTVDKSQFDAGTYRVRWYDPTTGLTTDAGTTTMGSGSQVFTPAGERVLLIDDETLGLGAP